MRTTPKMAFGTLPADSPARKALTKTLEAYYDARVRLRQAQDDVADAEVKLLDIVMSENLLGAVKLDFAGLNAYLNNPTV